MTMQKLDTHWVHYDEPYIGKRRRAACGELTDQESAEPTCPLCQKFLEKIAAETVESRFG